MEENEEEKKEENKREYNSIEDLQTPPEPNKESIKEYAKFWYDQVVVRGGLKWYALPLAVLFMMTLVVFVFINPWVTVILMVAVFIYAVLGVIFRNIANKIRQKKLIEKIDMLTPYDTSVMSCNSAGSYSVGSKKTDFYYILICEIYGKTVKKVVKHRYENDEFLKIYILPSNPKLFLTEDEYNEAMEKRNNKE